MRHPSDGTLRRLVDEPVGVADADRQHVAGCPVCLSGLAAVQEDAAQTGAALDVAFAVDVDAGWRRLSRAVATDEAPAAARGRSRPRLRATLRSPIIAAVGVVVLLTGAGAVAAAAKATGLPVPRVGELPRGVTGEPAFRVGGRVSAVFTFSAEKAARAAAAAGETLPAPPPGLDGGQFRLAAGPGLAAVWSEARGVPALIVARVVAPTGYSSSVPFETARDYLLSLPGLPKDVASQLRGFSGDGTTLPLPVSPELMK